MVSTVLAVIRGFFLWIIGRYHFAHGCDEGGLRLADRRDFLVRLPAAAKAFVDRDVLHDDAFPGDGVLILDFVKLTFGVGHVQEIRQAAIVSFVGQRHRPLAGDEGIVQIPQAVLLGGISAEGIFHFLDGADDHFFVIDQGFVGAEVLNVNLGVEGAEIQ